MIVVAPTLTEMWHNACERLLFSSDEEVDFSNSIYSFVYGNILEAKSMEFEYDLGHDSWLTIHRWRKLQRDYLVPGEVPAFVDRCVLIHDKEGRRGMSTQMFFRQMHRDVRNRNHSWGNCLMAVSYRGFRNKIPPTITVHSRSCFLAYLGGLDITLVLKIVEELCDRTSLTPADIRFRWYVDAIQWHPFKSIPYLCSRGFREAVLDEEEWPRAHYPSIRASRRWIEKFETDPLESFKFAQARRMATRWRQVNGGQPFPSYPVHELHLLPEMFEMEES